MKQHPRLISNHPSLHQETGLETGFSILEGVMAAVIIAVVTTGALTLYASYTKSLQINRRENQIQAAIAADLANILRANRRILCVNGSCAINPSDPGENDYYPDPLNEASRSYFDCDMCGRPAETCTKTPGLAGAAASLINSQVPQPTEFQDLRIRRNSAAAEDNTIAPNESKFRYVVSWSRTNASSSAAPLREVTLTPTVAGWCP